MLKNPSMKLLKKMRLLRSIDPEVALEMLNFSTAKKDLIGLFAFRTACYFQFLGKWWWITTTCSHYRKSNGLPWMLKMPKTKNASFVNNNTFFYIAPTHLFNAGNSPSQAWNLLALNLLKFTKEAIPNTQMHGNYTPIFPNLKCQSPNSIKRNCIWSMLMICW